MKPIKKILITGIYSRLGTRIREIALQQGCEVYGVDRMTRDPETLALDLTQKTALQFLTTRFKPDLVVHTAALTDVDLCESEMQLAWDANVNATENVAEFCSESDAKMAHISTDYIFDGNCGPYGEGDPANPTSVYGKTKLEAELKVQKILKDALIVRTAVPYDWNQNAKPNFLMWLIDRLEIGEPIRLVTDQWNTPTYFPHCAAMILELAHKNASGIFNVAGKEFISRYDFGLKVCSVFGYDSKLIAPCLSAEFKQTAPRPLKSGLKVDKAENFLRQKFPTIDEGLASVKKLREIINK